MSGRNRYRLPRNITPAFYDLELQPNMESFYFSGKEHVAIHIHEHVSRIVLHALNLEIGKAEVRYLDGSRFVPEKIVLSKKYETATFFFAEPLKSGFAFLSLEFRGRFTNKLQGFYKTSYDVQGERRWGAATQFEATDARRVFPCWDEPDQKAVFCVSIVVPRHLTALSNMPILQEELIGSDLKRVIYQPTPVMSTYLLAFVVAELECIEAQDKNGVPIRVWTTPGKKEHGRFALECALQTLPYFAEWFGIPYTLPKLDMVALPDFAFGAMENWGLVTYRETALLVDPECPPVTALEQVAEVVKHELAHQWFGNLVTMEWWTHLWLNEGFASYMGLKAVDHQFPEWDTWIRFVAGEMLSALAEDGMRNTHAVEIPVRNPHEIREIFDTISYHKGAAVNRMLEYYLGEDLRRGLHLYLNRHRFGNASTDDLWRALEEVSGKPVRKIMTKYTRQPGYPVVKVRKEVRKDRKKGNQSVLVLEQKRFLNDGSEDRENLTWIIPLGISLSGEAPQYYEMKRRTLRIPLEYSEEGWITLNPGQSGFYRVAYSSELWQNLVLACYRREVKTTDLIGVLDDAFALSRAGYMKTSDALHIVNAVNANDHFAVWIAAAEFIGAVAHLLRESPVFPKFEAIARSIFRKVAHKLSWEKSSEDSHLDILLRSLALDSLGRYGDKATIEEARKRFRRFVESGELDPNIRQVVYSLVARYGAEEEFESLMRIYNSTDFHEEKTRILMAFGNFCDEGLGKRVLDFSLSDSVRSQDWIYIIGSLGANPKARILVWNFLKQNWGGLTKRFPHRFLAEAIEVTAGGFMTQEDLFDVEKFLHTHPLPEAERTFRQVCEHIRTTIAWLERDGQDIIQWVENQYQYLTTEGLS